MLEEAANRGTEMHFSAAPARKGHSAPRGETSLHFIVSAQRAGTYLQKIQKFRGRIAILEKLGFRNPRNRAANSVFWASGFRDIDQAPGRITSRAKHERCSSGTHESS